jgi:hypothetical protein
MAVLINLCIHCGESEAVADKVLEHFQDYRLNLIDVGQVECEMWKEQNQLYGYWCVGIWPIRLGYGVTKKYEADLLEYEQAIGMQLYTHLSLTSGYRMALFGYEVFDMWKDNNGEQSDEGLMMDGTIYAEADFPSLTEDIVHKSPFIPGYAVYQGHFTEEELARREYYDRSIVRK